MNAELEKIKDAMDKSTGDGRDRELAVQLSDAYIAAHPAEFTELQDLSLEDCVTAVSTFRAAGLDESQWRVEAYLLSRYEPQQIGGTYEPQLRVPGL